jgi:2-polyprenyl-3-methyl-5-hydroxy-6-metoxy-1,4-benzoquinol methylase
MKGDVQDFKKYEDQQDYHWQHTYGSWKRRAPRLHARYDLAIKILKNKTSIKGKKVIDLGCGDGVLLYKLWRHGAIVHGLDGSPKAVGLGKKRLAKLGASVQFYEAGSVYSAPFEDSYFDAVVSVEVIEHLDDSTAFLKEIHRLLKPGGVFVCTTPSRQKGQAADQVNDPYHVKEYIAEELRQEISSIFGNSEVWGGYPKILDDLYVKGTGARFLDKSIRVFFKLLRSISLNPYHVSRKNPVLGSHALLISSAVKR